VADDWRLAGQERFLAGRPLEWAAWWEFRPGWDHDRCSFCWAEISDQPVGEHVSYNAAWVTADDNYHWVCPACFEDFADRFSWSIEGPAGSVL